MKMKIHKHVNSWLFCKIYILKLRELLNTTHLLHIALYAVICVRMDFFDRTPFSNCIF